MIKNEKQILTIVYLFFLWFCTQHYLFNGASMLVKIMAFLLSLSYLALMVIAIFDFSVFENFGKKNENK